MAILFPDLSKTRVVFPSQAEEQFYNLCQKLPRDWRVYYSCTLTSSEIGKGIQDNEIDFVLYHPRWGLLIIEVKGGQIKFEAEKGQFYSVNRHGKSFAIKNPFQQALTWRSRFLRLLRKKQIKLPMTYGVCFPTVDETDLPRTTEMDPSLVLGHKKLQDLEKSLIDMVKTSQPERFLNFENVADAMDDLLKGSNFHTRLHFRNYLDGNEMRVKDVETIQDTLVTPIAGSKKLGIEGEAGTGKTMLAVMLAKYFRSLSKRVLLLSSNPLLNAFLQKQVSKEVTVLTYSELASSFGVELLRRPAGYKGSREDWIQFEGVEKLKQAISEAGDAALYDVILCDEAQDVQPFWWEAIQSALRSPEDSHFYLFFDRSQGIFGSGSSESNFEPEDVLPVPAPWFPLIHNYRTTREIAGFSRHFRTGKEILKSHSARIGYIPQIITYKDDADARVKLEQLTDKLFHQEGLHNHEVTLLSARKPYAEGSVLAQQTKLGSLTLLDLGKIKNRCMPQNDEIKGKIKISTVSSFKGLETPVGVIMNLSEYNLPLENGIMASLFYVACTRAKHMLYVMVREDDKKRILLEQAIKALDQSGSITLGASLANLEFTGTVTHYNPERVGWLRVEDPAFENNKILFFPHDVDQAMLGPLEIGQKMIFRPQVEGGTTIACDLKIAVE